MSQFGWVKQFLHLHGFQNPEDRKLSWSEKWPITGTVYLKRLKILFGLLF